jgi:hypothetical protein
MTRNTPPPTALASQFNNCQKTGISSVQVKKYEFALKWLAHLLHIFEVLGSIIGQEVRYPDQDFFVIFHFPQSF